MSPSDIKKYGTHFDLPMAILIALHEENIAIRDICIWRVGTRWEGEVSSTLFPIVLSLKEQGCIDRRQVVPKGGDEIPIITINGDKSFIGRRITWIEGQ